MADELAPKPEILPVDRAALTMARNYGAVDEHGQLWCIVCSQRPGMLPHLACSICIGRFRCGLPLATPANDGGEP
jgi:hypothetical protein